MTAAEIRQAFIEFFAARQHKIVPSAPVAPQDDPTLLFINAGMNQFKDIFLGKGTRDYVRAVNSQKCIRVSGKHNDLEEVGPSPIHHTFFEMLGNWSFGDYYKTEAIKWAWEFFTGVLKLDKDRLYATVFTDDDESHQLWETETDINPSHISRHGHKDNFWEMGEVGPQKGEDGSFLKIPISKGPLPCGPCSEIHYDLGKPMSGHESPPNDGPNSDSGRFIELWNLVFIEKQREWISKYPEFDAQFDPEVLDDPRYYEGELGENELPLKHVDTGAGLERIARVMQGVESNYETDLFKPIISAISELTGVPYNLKRTHIPHRVIADHLRSLSFAIADGVLPSNEGRGYVLRRILRRAARFSRELKYEEPLLHELVPVLVDTMKEHFSELKERANHIEHVIRAEEESFGRTLDRGIEIFDRLVISKKKQIHGDENVITWLDNIILYAGQNENIPEAQKLISFAYHNRILKKSRALKPIEADFDVRKSLNDISAYDESGIIEDFTKDYMGFSDKFYIFGNDAFRLYDTYGFPLDLTKLMARERGLFVDIDGFNSSMDSAREKSRESAKFVMSDGDWTTVTEGKHSEFVGYDTDSVRASIRKVRIVEGKIGDANDPDVKHKPRLEIILEKTPFYAEAGGQASDHGFIRGSKMRMMVDNVRQEGDLRIHSGLAYRLPDDGTWPEQVEAKIDKARRNSIMPHHTTTHLLQAALRKLLGDHVTQAGSKVMPEYMTFDFTHFEKLTNNQLRETEALVNQWIREDYPVKSELTTVDKAKEEGAMALFGEKYGDTVRVIRIGDAERMISVELCGGTHLKRTGEAGLFRIESETAVSAGVRRIEATAGLVANNRTMAERVILDRITDMVGSRGSNPADKLAVMLQNQQDMEKEIEQLKKAVLQGSVRFVEDWGEEIDYGGQPVLLVTGQYEAATDRDSLQSLGDKIIADLQKAKRQGIGLVGALIDNTYMFVSVVTPGLVKRGIHSGKLVSSFAKKVGGGGGGKPNFATAGSKDPQSASALIKNRAEVKKFVEAFINK